MSSCITPELLSFAAKWSELQWWCNLPRNYSQNTSPSQGSLSRGRRVAKHTCALSTEPPPPPGFQHRDSELRAVTVSKTVILSVNASLRRWEGVWGGFVGHYGSILC